MKFHLQRYYILQIGVVNETQTRLQLLSQYFVTLSSFWQKLLLPDSSIRTENISATSYDSYIMWQQ